MESDRCLNIYQAFPLIVSTLDSASSVTFVIFWVNIQLLRHRKEFYYYLLRKNRSLFLIEPYLEDLGGKI